jgi:hypothetical protein
MYQYRGYLCTNGAVTNTGITRVLRSPLSTTCPDLLMGAACSNDTGCCVEERLVHEPFDAKQAEANGAVPRIQVYERGVPNPGNLLSKPDEPILLAPVLGEYTAEFNYLHVPIRVRLLLYAGFPFPMVYGHAYLIDPRSPPSPMWNPHFKGAWVRVRIDSLGLFVLVPGLPEFFLVQ